MKYCVEIKRTDDPQTTWRSAWLETKSEAVACMEAFKALDCRLQEEPWTFHIVEG